MRLGERFGEPFKCQSLCARQRRRTDLFDQRYGRQKNVAGTQLIRYGVRQDEPLSRLHRHRGQPFDELPKESTVELPQAKPLEEFLQMLAPCFIPRGVQ